ncbi:MAG: sulfotransferase, partial [Planctomycetota bacterium]
MAASEHDDIAQGLFFIVGTGRCGSTLLQAMLSRHPRLGLPPETKFFQEWDPMLRISDPLPDEASLRQHLAWAGTLWFWQDLALDEEQLLRDAEAGGRSARALFLGVMAQWRDRLGKPRLGEKTPGHHKHVERILELFPQAKIIHIHRDPRDVVASIVKLRWGGHSSARRHARTWAKAVRRQRLLAEQLGPDRHHT